MDKGKINNQMDYIEYKNYIKAREWYSQFGDMYGDSIIISSYENKLKNTEKPKVLVKEKRK